ncbi:hypothetical protein [Polaromonas sp. YR568]|uniref:hypothetical protein n=1 Tax=Polaromonas sp. YR568 TaxID=1855301 RepID=UPI00398BFAEA
MSTRRSHSPDGGVPLGAGSSDEPAHTLPTQITRAPAGKADATHKRASNEEPEPTIEDDLPSDGRDEKGEAMIRDLPRKTGKKEK